MHPGSLELGFSVLAHCRGDCPDEDHRESVESNDECVDPYRHHMREPPESWMDRTSPTIDLMVHSSGRRALVCNSKSGCPSTCNSSSAEINLAIVISSSIPTYRMLTGIRLSSIHISRATSRLQSERVRESRSRVDKSYTFCWLRGIVSLVLLLSTIGCPSSPCSCIQPPRHRALGHHLAFE